MTKLKLPVLAGFSSRWLGMQGVEFTILPIPQLTPVRNSASLERGIEAIYNCNDSLCSGCLLVSSCFSLPALKLLILKAKGKRWCNEWQNFEENWFPGSSREVKGMELIRSWSDGLQFPRKYRNIFVWIGRNYAYFWKPTCYAWYLAIN